MTLICFSVDSSPWYFDKRLFACGVDCSPIFLSLPPAPLDVIMADQELSTIIPLLEDVALSRYLAGEYYAFDQWH
jgi:hypothetical protein